MVALKSSGLEIKTELGSEEGRSGGGRIYLRARFKIGDEGEDGAATARVSRVHWQRPDSEAQRKRLAGPVVYLTREVISWLGGYAYY